MESPRWQVTEVGLYPEGGGDWRSVKVRFAL